MLSVMSYFSLLAGLEVAEIYYSCGSGGRVGSGGWVVGWSGRVGWLDKMEIRLNSAQNWNLNRLTLA